MPNMEDADQDIINENTLDILRDAIGDEAMNDFLVRFLEDCADRTQKILTAYEQGDFSILELEAHTLGTSAATYGASRLEKICRDIEYAKPYKDAYLEECIRDLLFLSQQSIKILNTHVQ